MPGEISGINSPQYQLMNIYLHEWKITTQGMINNSLNQDADDQRDDLHQYRQDDVDEQIRTDARNDSDAYGWDWKAQPRVIMSELPRYRTLLTDEGDENQ